MSWDIVYTMLCDMISMGGIESTADADDNLVVLNSQYCKAKSLITAACNAFCYLPRLLTPPVAHWSKGDKGSDDSIDCISGCFLSQREYGKAWTWKTNSYLIVADEEPDIDSSTNNMYYNYIY